MGYYPETAMLYIIMLFMKWLGSLIKEVIEVIEFVYYQVKPKAHFG